MVTKPLTADVVVIARKLIKRARENGKPLRVFAGNHRGTWTALDTRSTLRQHLPIRDLVVTADLTEDALAETLRTIWAELSALAPDVGPQSSVPSQKHGWRNPEFRSRRKQAVAR